jgi:hypothetical protein
MMSVNNTKYFIATGEDVSGPYSLTQLRGLYRNGSFTFNSLIRSETENDWSSVDDYVQILELPDVKSEPKTAPAPRIEIPPFPDKIKISDIEMKFTSMVVFMVKWAIAAIPAYIILLIITFVLIFLIFVIFGSMLNSLL